MSDKSVAVFSSIDGAENLTQVGVVTPAVDGVRSVLLYPNYKGSLSYANLVFEDEMQTHSYADDAPKGEEPVEVEDTPLFDQLSQASDVSDRTDDFGNPIPNAMPTEEPDDLVIKEESSES